MEMIRLPRDVIARRTRPSGEKLSLLRRVAEASGGCTCKEVDTLFELRSLPYKMYHLFLMLLKRLAWDVGDLFHNSRGFHK